MKIFKIIGEAILSLLLILYISFLFVLPNVINLNKFILDINKIGKNAGEYELNIKNAKIKTYWNLQIKILLEETNIKYKKQSLIAAKNIEAGIKLFPLIKKNIELAPIKLSNPKLIITIEKDGRYNVEKILSNIINDLQKKPTTTTQTQPKSQIKLSENLPNIILENYNITINDSKTNDTLAIKGPELKIYDFSLNNKIKLLTNGEIDINNKKHITYNIKIDSFLPKTDNNTTTQEIKIPQFTYNPIPVIKKYNFGAVLETDLKISEQNKEILLKGFLNAKELNYKIQGNNISNSFLKLNFKGNTIDISSELFVDKTEKFSINGLFKTGKNQYIDLKILSQKIDIVDIQRTIIALLDIANIKNDIIQFNITGKLDSNFRIKSNMKKIESDGFLKVENASIRHSKLPLSINSIKSDINFNDNKLEIKNTSALINNALFNVSGLIDTNANTDIKITANELPLNLLYEAFAPVNIKKAISFRDGKLSLDTIIKGKLDKIEPKINLLLSNLNIKENSTKSSIKVANTSINLTTNIKGEYKGNAKVTQANLSIPEPKTVLSLPNGELNFDTKNITIKPTTIKLDNSTFTIDGTIKDYTNKLNALINTNGTFISSDILKYMPKEINSFVKTKGSLPIKATITSDGKNTKIQGQTYADNQNFISMLDVNSIKNKPSIINIELETDTKNLNIIDCSLYGLNKPITLSNTYKSNITNSAKIAGINGKITNLLSQTPTLQNIKITTPNTITASIPNLSNSSITLKSDISINGTIQNPTIKGAISIPTITIPDYIFSGKNINIDFSKDVITAKSTGINLNGSDITFNTIIDNNFNKNTIIKDLTISSQYIDIDGLFTILEKMPQNNVAPSANIPVTIQKGQGNIAKIKSGNLIATNATGDFTLKNNLFKLSNIKASAYNGIVAGNVEYNIPYETTKAILQGRALDSNPSLTAVTGLKDQLQGKLDFDADISMMGSKYEQQMKTLKGTVKFIVNDGQMGSLGRLEHLIYASNMISQKFANSTLNSVIQTLSPKNTGKFNYIKGNISFTNGWAKLNPVHSGGPQMSLYITGDYNLLNNYAKLEILGRVAKEIVNIMGPVGDMSISKLLSNFSNFGSNASNILNNYNAIKDEKTIAKVPQLIPASEDTKQFQVVIDGNIEKPTAVRSFKWIASESEIKAAKAQINSNIQNIIPTQIKNVLKQTITNTTPKNNQEIENKLKDTTTEQLKKALPSFWDNIE